MISQSFSIYRAFEVPHGRIFHPSISLKSHYELDVMPWPMFRYTTSMPLPITNWP